MLLQLTVSFIDWHFRREYVLSIFEMHPAITHYVDLVYGDLLRNYVCVSVHLRLGYEQEPFDWELKGFDVALLFKLISLSIDV